MGNAAFPFWVLIVCFAGGAQYPFSNAIQLTIEPPNFDPFLAQTVVFRCELDSSDVRHVKKVDVIEIFEADQRQLASVSHNRIHYTPEVGNKFQVDGQIGSTVDQSFLRLILLNPKVEDSGLYTCVMYYEDATTLRKAETNQTLTVSTMKEEIQTLATKIKTLKKRFEDKGGTVGRINKLQKRIEKHSTWIDELNSAGDFITAFSASLNTDFAFKSGRTIVFDRIIMQKGKAYDRTTGVFTAPRDGLYFFYLALGTQKPTAKGNYVKIVVNGKTSIAHMEVGHPNWQDDNSVNAVTKLTKGDTVQVAMTVGSAPFRPNKISIFGGYCVRAS